MSKSFDCWSLDFSDPEWKRKLTEMVVMLDLERPNQVFEPVFDLARAVLAAHLREHTIIARAPDGQETMLNELLIPTKKPLP